jgi:signal transduction histidine kinase
VIAVAAVVPQSVVETTRARRHDVVAAASFVVVLAAALAVLDALRPSESVPAHLDLTRPAIEHHVDLLVPQVGAIVCCTVAAIGFSRRAALLGDRFYASVAAGTTLAAFARLHYILFAPTLTGLVRTGDAFRFLFYGVLLVGAGREIRSYWRGLADSAVLEERRRIARDLHDGVAQELAFIGRRARRLDDARAREIAAAAERGLNDSRRAIAALTQPLDRDLADVLAEALGDVAGRHGVALDLHLAREVEVDAEAREALARIACEAVANAARHGGAEIVRVELSRGDRIRFAVEDRGRGFDPRSPAPGRFGLTIMRERAEAVGGSFRIASRPGSGTTVEVEL